VDPPTPHLNGQQRTDSTPNVCPDASRELSVRTTICVTIPKVPPGDEADELRKGYVYDRSSLPIRISDLLTTIST
jgi:hypothetical protein